MGGIRKFKKNEKGESIRFITRNAAARKLQISLKLFRKLCIIKGIHPRDPKKKLQGKHKTYYYMKDIRFLQHEPIIQTLRDRKTFAKKEKRLRERKDWAALEVFIKSRPSASIDHIVRERYPSFTDALKDLDDCLTLIHLFASMDSSAKLRENHIITCAELCREFQHFVTVSKSLKKVFVSIKGIYYQAEIMGETITWLAPINYINKKEKKVDYGVMINFLEFYEVMLKFVNYKLFTSIGLKYPPTVDKNRLNNGEYLSSITSEPINKTTTTSAKKNSKQQPLSKEDIATQKKINEITKSMDEEDDEEMDEDDVSGGKLELNSKGISKDFEDLVQDDKEGSNSVVKLTDQTNLFKGLKFFCSREVPKHALEFVIQSFGGEVAWDGGAFSESDQTITHQIIDRNTQEKIYPNREYVQPQWVFDSVNSQILMDATEYTIGVVPPPHLSPFVEYDESSYIPARKQILDEMIQQKGFDAASVILEKEDEEESEDEDAENSEEDDSDDDEDDIAAMEARYMKDLKKEEISKKRKVAEEEEEVEEKVEEDEEEEEEIIESEEEDEKKLSKKKSDKKKKQEQEELKLAEMMIRKKDKWLYQRIKNRNESAERNKNKLMTKRTRIESGKNVDGIPKSDIVKQDKADIYDHNYVQKPVLKEGSKSAIAAAAAAKKPTNKTAKSTSNTTVSATKEAPAPVAKKATPVAPAKDAPVAKKATPAAKEASAPAPVAKKTTTAATKETPAPVAKKTAKAAPSPKKQVAPAQQANKKVKTK